MTSAIFLAETAVKVLDSDHHYHVSPKMTARGYEVLALAAGRLCETGSAFSSQTPYLEAASAAILRHIHHDVVVTEGLHALSQLLRCRSDAATSAPPVLLNAELGLHFAELGLSC